MFGVSYSIIDILPLLSVLITITLVCIITSSSSITNHHHHLASPWLSVRERRRPKVGKRPMPWLLSHHFFIFILYLIFSSLCPGCTFPSSRSPCPQYHQGCDQEDVCHLAEEQQSLCGLFRSLTHWLRNFLHLWFERWWWWWRQSWDLSRPSRPAAV